MGNGGRMKLFEVIRYTTIVQRILIVGSIIWLFGTSSVNMGQRYGFDLGEYISEGLIPVVLLWGAYWIFIGIIEKRKNK